MSTKQVKNLNKFLSRLEVIIFTTAFWNSAKSYSAALDTRRSSVFESRQKLSNINAIYVLLPNRNGGNSESGENGATKSQQAYSNSEGKLRKSLSCSELICPIRNTTPCEKNINSKTSVPTWMAGWKLNIQEQSDKNETGKALKGFMITNKGECGWVGILKIPEHHRIPDSLEAVLIRRVLERSAENFLLNMCRWGRRSSIRTWTRAVSTFQTSCWGFSVHFSPSAQLPGMTRLRSQTYIFVMLRSEIIFEFSQMLAEWKNIYPIRSNVISQRWIFISYSARLHP